MFKTLPGLSTDIALENIVSQAFEAGRTGQPKPRSAVLSFQVAIHEAYVRGVEAARPSEK